MLSKCARTKCKIYIDKHSADCDCCMTTNLYWEMASLRRNTWVTTSGSPASVNCATRRRTSSSASMPLSGLPTDSSYSASRPSPHSAAPAASRPLHCVRQLLYPLHVPKLPDRACHAQVADRRLVQKRRARRRAVLRPPPAGACTARRKGKA